MEFSKSPTGQDSPHCFGRIAALFTICSSLARIEQDLGSKHSESLTDNLMRCGEETLNL
jgi:hypothetical protein